MWITQNSTKKNILDLSRIPPTQWQSQTKIYLRIPVSPQHVSCHAGWWFDGIFVGDGYVLIDNYHNMMVSNDPSWPKIINWVYTTNYIVHKLVSFQDTHPKKNNKHHCKFMIYD